MQLYVPVYKSEAGVHTQVPPVQEFNTIATVSGAGVPKPGTEVLIKWDGGTSHWLEVDVWDPTVKIATRTNNPLDSTVAYLYIPIMDYLAVYTCCNTSSGAIPGPGEGGGSPSNGRVQWNAGVVFGGTPPVLSYEFVLQDMVAAAPFMIIAQAGMKIDWGNGVLYSYGPFDTPVVRTFADGYDGTITVYHDDSPTILTGQDDTGGFRGIVSSIAGDIPTALEVFQTANSWPALVAGYTPTTLKQVALTNTSLSSAEINTFLDFLIDSGILNGRFSALPNPRQDADLTKLNTLISRGWTVQAYGIYPNL